MKHICLLLAVWVFCLVCASAEETSEEIFLPTGPCLSPDGNTLAFSWKGDIWSSPVQGGVVCRLTQHPAEDRSPCFSPDGKKIAFVSNRHGSSQVYVMPSKGGYPERLTFHSEGYSLIEWTSDGASLLVSGSRDHFWRGANRLFLIPGDRRGPETLLFDAEVKTGTLSPDKKSLLYTREGYKQWRKGYVGSMASQIWLYNREDKTHTPLLKHERGSWEPRWKPDGTGFYFVSGESGSYNLWEFDLLTKNRRQLTFFKDDSVIKSAISRDGTMMVFRHLFYLYAFKPGSKDAPEKISLFCDLDQEKVVSEKKSSTSASHVSFSGDGLEMAFISGGNLWVMDSVLREPKQITHTPGFESECLFMPDNNAILFISDVEGQVDLWQAERADPEQYWWLNETFKLKRLTNDEAVESRLSISPDSKKIGFLKGAGDLWVANKDGLEARKVISSWSRVEYDWSPDGQWLVYALEDNDFNRDVWVKPIDNSQAPYNLSRHPDNDGNPVWSPDGKVIAFTGRRSEKEVDIYYIWLNKEDHEKSKRDRSLAEALEKLKKSRKKKGEGGGGKQKKKEEKGKKDPKLEAQKKELEAVASKIEELCKGKENALLQKFLEQMKKGIEELIKPKKKEDKKDKLVIDFDGIHERLRRVSIPDSRERGLFWSHDSKKLAFSASIDGKRGTYTIEFPDGMKPKLLSTKSGRNARWIKEGNKIVWLADGKPGTLSSSGKAESFSFKAQWESCRADHLRAGFVTAWRNMRDSYYDPNLNNRDWNLIRKKYEDMAARAPDMKVFGEIVQLMLGELNGSHLGYYGPGRSWSPGDDWRETTAHLGLRFESGFQGPGLKVKDVIPKGPADQKKSRVCGGEIVKTINGKEVGPKMDLTLALNGPLERDIQLQVVSVKGEEREVVIRPTRYSTARRLLKTKWVQECRDIVTKGSEGKLGYLFIPGMNWSSFLEFERELYAEGAGKEGLIIDVRNNGGGFTADHVLTVLCQPAHAITIPRGGGPGYPQDRKVYASWRKPIVMLCNQNSFSNAEIISHAVKILKRGKLVGVRTAGGVISTGGAAVMDLGMVRMPFRGWFKIDDGQDQELNGAIPHYELWPHPGDMVMGKDVQLEKAVEVLLREVKAAPKLPTPIYRHAK